MDPSLDLEDLKLFIFIFFFMQKNIYLYKKWKQFCKKNAKKYERKIIIIWPSDAGTMRWLFQQPINPVYYIEDCQNIWYTGLQGHTSV